VWRYLYSSGYVLPRFQIAPHTLSPDQKAARVALAIELTKPWRSQTAKLASLHDGLRVMVLLWHRKCAYVGCQRRYDARSAEVNNQESKTDAGLFWSPLGFAVVKILLKGAHFDATYLCSEIFSKIDQNRPLLTVEGQ
jgi:hypothetical protein